MDICNVKNHTCTTTEAQTPEKVEDVEPRAVFIPSVDVLESDAEMVLYADMPGVDESAIEVTLEKNVLTIKGKPISPDFAGRELIYSEFGFGEYERSFTLSDGLDRDGISASIKNGVLLVKLPKLAPATKKITVASAQ